MPRRQADYGWEFRVLPRPHELSDPWPEPPDVDNPFALLDPAQDVAPPRRFDVELFMALNAEYAGHPIAATAPSYQRDPLVERSRRRLAAIHARIDLRDKTVLEVGCGSGMEVWHVAHAFGSDAWGIDVQARRAWPNLVGDRVHLVLGSISSDSGLPGGAFDRVLSNTVWEHIEQPHRALAEMFRVMKPGGLAWIRANLYRGPTASHRTRDIAFPFPHLLFTDEVIAEGLRRIGKPAHGAAWVNRLTWEQYEAHMLEVGFMIRSLRFDLYPLDEAFYARFEDILGRYPRRDLERGFFTVILEKPRR